VNRPLLAMAAALLLVLGVARAQQQIEPLSAFPQSLLAVRTAGHNVIKFKIWTADTPTRDQQGLMFVRTMDLHAGMLFLFPKNERVAMWMKNTYMPLDMLFMNRRGVIDYIAANTTPFSEAIIGPITPEYAVLELNGGASEHLGIKVGDTVIHPSFKVPKAP
jgi:uncharacterized membrane protein (UPF0127 family)